MSEHFNETWNEHQWEQHIDEMESKTHRLKNFIDQGWGDPDDPNWVKFLKEYESVDEALNAYLDEELSFDDAFFPDDLNEFEDEFEDDEDLFTFLEYLNDLDDEMDEEEEDPLLFESEDEDYLGGINDYFGFIDHFLLYEDARDLSLYLMFMGKESPEYRDYDQFNQLVDHLLTSTSKLSASTVFDAEDLQHTGAIIAYCKKALGHLNEALLLLPLVKSTILSPKEYQPYHRSMFELRNDVALYIQELREYFNENNESGE